MQQEYPGLTVALATGGAQSPGSGPVLSPKSAAGVKLAPLGSRLDDSQDSREFINMSSLQSPAGRLASPAGSAAVAGRGLSQTLALGPAPSTSVEEERRHLDANLKGEGRLRLRRLLPWPACC